jgi:hypothetical protein
MAKATIKLETVKKVVEVEEEVEVIHLAISRKEAETLHDILISFGGDRKNSRRKYSLAVLDGIRSVLFKNDNRPFHGDISGHWFRDIPNV